MLDQIVGYMLLTCTWMDTCTVKPTFKNALRTRFLYPKSRNFLYGGYVNFQQILYSVVHFKSLV
jgi:hypothetical protein